MVELVDTPVRGTGVARRVGSSPTVGTFNEVLNCSVMLMDKHRGYEPCIGSSSLSRSTGTALSSALGQVEQLDKAECHELWSKTDRNFYRVQLALVHALYLY